MKFCLMLLFVLIANQLVAQTVNGIVFDVATRLPISNAQVIMPTSTSLTDRSGKFKLNNFKIGDKFAIRMIGYETMEYTIGNITDSLRIYLKQSVFQLNEVMVRANRNYKIDSIKLRKEYAAVFAYKSPGFTDMFINVNPNYRPPLALVRPNSTASIVNLNVLSVLKLLGKKKNITAKFKQTLLHGEETNYVDHLFSKEKVADITKLKGDSLVNFMNIYRPSVITLRKMTGYELLQYIKTSYAAFIKP